MKRETIDYVRYRLERAHEALYAAQAAIDKNLCSDAVNRIYYACFYAVMALLVIEGLKTAKHSGVRSYFDKYFVKTGQFPKEMSKFYHEIFDFRIESDYKDFTRFELPEVVGWLAEAKDFVQAVSQKLKQLMPDLQI